MIINFLGFKVIIIKLIIFVVYKILRVFYMYKEFEVS